MFLLHLRPEQLRDAVERNVPVIMAAGVVEYHGEHLPIGTDILIAKSIVDEVEKRCECIVAPEFPFGSTMNWAGGPKDGDMDFDPDVFYKYAKEVFRFLMDSGFKRIYVLQHHQGAEGLQSLSLRRAATELLREKSKAWEEGWGRGINTELPPKHFWKWIKIGYVDTYSKYPTNSNTRIPIGHAGKGETQLIMNCLPETVRLEALKGDNGVLPRWLADANEATAEEGNMWFEFCVQGWTEELKGI